MKNPFRVFIAGLVGTIVVALCCFTPYFALLLAFLGLALITPYLDFILIPLLIIFITLTIFSFIKWKRSPK